jgi:cell cycle checkpoint protein
VAEGHEIVFEIDLTTLLQCLNIFGNAGTAVPSKSGQTREEYYDSETPHMRFKSKPKEDRATALRMTYAGSGYPLVLVFVYDLS